MLQLYKNIRYWRQERGMSQEELARIVGYSGKSMIARIERGDVDLPQSKIMAFARALDVPPGDLMGWDDPDEIPIYTAAAGNPVINCPYADEFMPANEYPRKTHGMLRVCGTSMMPTLEDGDFVIVEYTKAVYSEHDIAAVKIGGDAVTLKHVRFQNGILTLFGENPRAYLPKDYSQTDVQELPVEIVGRVCEIRRKL